jgi:hypothetical protein
MELIGQRVHDRDAAGGRHRRNLVLAECAPGDGGDLPRQHPGYVLDRLTPASMGPARVDDQGVPAQLGDADCE